MRYFLLSILILSQAAFSEEILVNRTVLILDFVNTTNSKKVKYLEISIPEAYVEALQRTKKFTIINRDKAQRIVEKQKIKRRSLYSEGTAIGLGRALRADVVLIGNFTKVKRKVKIQAKAIDISTERTVVSRSKVAKTDGSIFAAISNLADEMSNEMAKKLKPLPQKVITKAAGKTLPLGFYLYAGYNAIHSDFKDVLSKGMTSNLGFRYNLLTFSRLTISPALGFGFSQHKNLSTDRPSQFYRPWAGSNIRLNLVKSLSLLFEMAAGYNITKSEYAINKTFTSGDFSSFASINIAYTIYNKFEIFVGAVSEVTLYIGPNLYETSAIFGVGYDL